MKTLIQGGYVVGYNGKEHIIFENVCVVYENEFINYVSKQMLKRKKQQTHTHTYIYIYI